MLNKHALDRAMFPVGNLYKKKDVIGTLAIEAGMERLTSRKESMGICFVGKKNRFGKFISEYLEGIKEGNFISGIDGKVLGRHFGLPFYTIGQAARLHSMNEK